MWKVLRYAIVLAIVLGGTVESSLRAALAGIFEPNKTRRICFNVVIVLYEKCWHLVHDINRMYAQDEHDVSIGVN